MVHLVGDVFNMDTINGKGVLKFFRDRYNDEIVHEMTMANVSISIFLFLIYYFYL